MRSTKTAQPSQSRGHLIYVHMYTHVVKEERARVLRSTQRKTHHRNGLVVRDPSESIVRVEPLTYLQDSDGNCTSIGLRASQGI